VLLLLLGFHKLTGGVDEVGVGVGVGVGGVDVGVGVDAGVT